jgi:hypothetical protein
MTHKKLAKYIKVGDRIALPGVTGMVDPYDIDIVTVTHVYSDDGWTYLEQNYRLDDELSVTVVLPEQNSAGTRMVRIEDHDLKTLRTMLSGKGGTQPYLLRVDQRGDSVAFKVNEGTWTHGMGTAQAPY